MQNNQQERQIIAFQDQVINIVHEAFMNETNAKDQTAALNKCYNDLGISDNQSLKTEVVNIANSIAEKASKQDIEYKEFNNLDLKPFYALRNNIQGMGNIQVTKLILPGALNQATKSIQEGLDYFLNTGALTNNERIKNYGRAALNIQKIKDGYGNLQTILGKDDQYKEQLSNISKNMNEMKTAILEGYKKDYEKIMSRGTSIGDKIMNIVDKIKKYLGFNKSVPGRLNDFDKKRLNNQIGLCVNNILKSGDIDTSVNGLHDYIQKTFGLSKENNIDKDILKNMVSNVINDVDLNSSEQNAKLASSVSKFINDFESNSIGFETSSKFDKKDFKIDTGEDNLENKDVKAIKDNLGKFKESKTLNDKQKALNAIEESYNKIYSESNPIPGKSNPNFENFSNSLNTIKEDLNYKSRGNINAVVDKSIKNTKVVDKIMKEINEKKSQEKGSMQK